MSNRFALLTGLPGLCLKRPVGIVLLSLVWALLTLPACSDNDGAQSGSCPDQRAPGADFSEPAAPAAVSWYVPPATVSWQWQLSGQLPATPASDVELYDVDLFDTPASLIADYQAAGKKVMCYFSAGSAENWRSDYGDYDDRVLGQPLDGWAGERWVDINAQNVWDVIDQRLQLAADKGCDAVEPDNVNGWQNDTCFLISRSEQLLFNKNLAARAHELGLGIALKNEGENAVELAPHFDLVLNEECNEFDECGLYQPFIDGGKAALGAEYAPAYLNDAAERSAMCSTATADGWRTLILPLELDGSVRYACWQL